MVIPNKNYLDSLPNSNEGNKVMPNGVEIDPELLLPID